MKLNLECSVCHFFKKQINDGRKIPTGTTYNLLPTPDDKLVTYDCPGMHSSITIIENHKFDLLFESGLHSLKNLYYRESVASFASALERFYEYIIIQILFKNIEIETIQKTWKQVSNQSERQLGGFIFLYSNIIGEPPKLLHNNMVKFRNQVIHKGYFPTYDESNDFLKAVAENIEKTYSKLKDKIDFSKYDEFLYLENRKKAENKINEYIPLGPRAIGSEYKVFKRPFTNRINTFLSDLNMISLENIKDYIEDLNEYYT